MNDKIEINRKTFTKYIDSAQIKRAVKTLAQRINEDYQGEQICFIVVLSGAFMFAADLIREIKNDSDVYFIKLSSYEGTTSHQVRQSTQLDVELTDKNIIIIEDIVETGNTTNYLIQEIIKHKPRNLDVCTLLFKPNKFEGDYKVTYVGKEIEDDFVVGYGMDYDQSGRGLEDIYQLNEI